MSLPNIIAYNKPLEKYRDRTKFHSHVSELSKTYRKKTLFCRQIFYWLCQSFTKHTFEWRLLFQADFTKSRSRKMKPIKWVSDRRPVPVRGSYLLYGRPYVLTQHSLFYFVYFNVMRFREYHQWCFNYNFDVILLRHHSRTFPFWMRSSIVCDK